MEDPLAQQEADGQALVVARGSHGDRDAAGNPLAVGGVFEADFQRLLDGDAIRLRLPGRAGHFFDSDLNGAFFWHDASTCANGRREKERLSSS